MTQLLDKLQSATEGSREISDAVLLACGWTIRQSDFSKIWEGPDGQRFDYRDSPGFKEAPFPGRPDPSRSLDAAVSLAMEMGATSIRLYWRQGELAKAQIGFPWDEGVPFYESGSTLALAACGTTTKAHESKEAEAA